MRTLDFALTTAQRSASRTPFIRLFLANRARTTTYTYTTIDTPNRILSVRQVESQFSGNLNSSEALVPISAIIQLRDHDQAVSAIDFRGFIVNIGWGLKDAAAVNRYSEAGPVIVVSQGLTSAPGELVVELHCMSLWDYVAQLWLQQLTAKNIQYAPGGSDEATVKEILHELLGGSTLGNDSSAAALLDGTVVHHNIVLAQNFSFAVQARNRASSGLNDVLLLPNPPAIGDVTYFGKVEFFDRISIDLTTPSTGTIFGAWEFWNGTTWAALSYVGDDGLPPGSALDGTNGFTIGTLKIVAFDHPATWTLLNASIAGPNSAVFPNNPLYYVRFRVISVSTPTQPKATRVLAGKYLGVALDTSVAGQGDDYKPDTERGLKLSDDLTGVANLILSSYTTLGVKVRKDGFHISNINNAQVTPDYTYNLLAGHTIFVTRQDKSLIIPNKIIYTQKMPGETPAGFEGSAQDASSVAQLGLITQIVVDPALSSDSVGNTMAQRRIDGLVRDTTQGMGTAPMNVGQEVYDLVEIVDGRSTYTWKGRLMYLGRTYQPGVYNIDLVMGRTVVAPTWSEVTKSSVGVSQYEYPTKGSEIIRLIQVIQPVYYQSLTRERSV